MCNCVILSPTITQLENLNNHWERETYSETDHKGKISDHQKKIEELWDKPEVQKNTITNESSIAFLLKYKQNTILFMGDANPITIQNTLLEQGYNENNKLKLSYMKLSHHGSKYGISSNLLKIITCNHFLISTKGTRYGHPDKEALARIIKNRNNSNKIYFYFNYKYGNIITKEEMRKYNIVCEVKTTFNIS